MLQIDMKYQWRDFVADYQVSFSTGMHCIVGASGGGKSTLLALLGGYLRGEGKVTYNGAQLEHLAPYERPMTTLFQSDNLFPQLTVWDNVAIGVAPNRKLDSEQHQKVLFSLAQVGLEGFKDKLPHTLSGGQAQRVAIARTLVRNAPILLLDEPFSALDPDLREAMLRLIQELTLANDWTTLMVTHQPYEAQQLEARVVNVNAGRICE
ncbi:ATP-binding cassette domain-containing protein [Maribrevibacterium harenarium]|uniref:ATP-binding cassette domain-containing protein n=1 Tax=Maribrevibacterium harenarium TaxID=2589817 RepID=A0A501X2F9_9GAMM|nr:ATP-binding cassette domain-containing protein [Maribrevibacterium harenarium]TPE54672.1 ATP-binding cassette domain-containing protein [Maribrevibacterium harenarium]